MNNHPDPAAIRYRNKRLENWNAVSIIKEKKQGIGKYYHDLLKYYYKFTIPSGLKVLEFGCGHGDLLSAVEPSFGVGIDFSHKMIKYASLKHKSLYFLCADAHEVILKTKFDVIILSDLVNDLWDVQRVLERLKDLSHAGTRIVINYFNNLWRIPLGIIKSIKLGHQVLEQNWLTNQDISNLLKISGFETIKHNEHIITPFYLPILSAFTNRYLLRFPPFKWLALTNMVIARPEPHLDKAAISNLMAVSIIVPARNEAGNIEEIINRTPPFGKETEIIFVEGHSNDSTFETIKKMIEKYPDRNIKVYQQNGKGKGDAVRLGFEKASGEILMILDADMTVPPELLPRFYETIVSEKGEFINGVRLVYPMEDQAMRFFNIAGNKFFSLAFSWLLGQSIKDTLCGTKVLFKHHYEMISKHRKYFGDFDPFGDFDLLFGAAKLNLKITELPLRYRSRTYGDTNIDRWSHGWLLLKMVFFAAQKIKFI
ncbi:MAG: bifunctional class I SAM-dependent methyltransferase/glycosyltransferase family 2 protein [Pseudomonadota bacterium]